MTKEKICKYIFFLFIFFFFAMLFALKNGYYETNTTKAKNLTEEQIKLFEQDLKEGKDIDIKDYVVAARVDYSTKLSNSLYKASLNIEKYMDKAIKFIFKRVSKAIND